MIMRSGFHFNHHDKKNQVSR